MNNDEQNEQEESSSTTVAKKMDAAFERSDNAVREEKQRVLANLGSLYKRKREIKEEMDQNEWYGVESNPRFQPKRFSLYKAIDGDKLKKNLVTGCSPQYNCQPTVRRWYTILRGENGRTMPMGEETESGAWRNDVQIFDCEDGSMYVSRYGEKYTLSHTNASGEENDSFYFRLSHENLIDLLRSLMEVL